MSPLRFRIDIRSDEHGRFYIFFLASDVGGIPGAEVIAALNGVAYNLGSNPASNGVVNGVVPLYIAPPVLPAGWEETLDGVSVSLDTGTGAQTATRTYRRVADEHIVTAPCAPDGSLTARGVATIANADAECPLSTVPEA